MSYFLLPKVYSKIYKIIEYNEEPENATENDISKSLYSYLLNIKSKIDEYSQWDVIKKYTNPYEYIHTMVSSSRNSVCKYKPISRSYFKMIEIVNTFHLLETFSPDYPTAAPELYLCPPPPGLSPRAPSPETGAGFRSFHLAEGPGGFIEAIANMRRNPRDVYIGMTLIDDKNENVPGWKKSRAFLAKNPNIIIERGADGTGNILSLENLNYCCENYGSSMDFITGDGGFDFSLNFNEQEKVIIPLLFAQLCYAIIMQKRGGTFILKIFDCFMNSTVDIIYILCAFYKKVYIIKPQTSRYANSERYVVCMGFLHSTNHDFVEYFRRAFVDMLHAESIKKNQIIPRFLNCKIQYLFIKRLEECNSVIGKQQLENIYNTINLLENKHKNERIEYMKKSNIQRCIDWCIENNMPYNQCMD